MKLERIERITVDPDPADTLEEIESLLNGLENIEVIRVLVDKPPYVFEVSRALELYPDTIR